MRSVSASIAPVSSGAPETSSTNSPRWLFGGAVEPGQRCAELAAMDALEQFGDLACEHDLAPLAKHRLQVFHTFEDTVRRFVEHEG